MPKHTVGLKIEHEIAVGNVDVVLPVKADGKPLGRVRISRGGIDWIPTGMAKSGYTLNWAKFGEVMSTEGRRKK
jgi:hypothetical protein